MAKSKMDKLQSVVGKLTADECLMLERALKERESQVEGALVLQQRADRMDACPHCGSTHVIKYGRRNGIQRFKCEERKCGKAFSPTTGTPLEGLRHPEKHIAHAQRMIQGLTIRQTAEELGVDITTAFRWRHRFLAVMSAMNPTALSGIVEADETFFLESFKGKRKGLPRAAKKRGMPAKKRGLSKEQIPVLVARDRSTGATLTQRIPARSGAAIGAVLWPVLADDAVLCADEAHAYRYVARMAHIDLRAVAANPKRKRKGATYHIQNVNAYDSRLKGWMERFHGVATKNLPNYLGWHRQLDTLAERPTARRFLATALDGNPV